MTDGGGRGATGLAIAAFAAGGYGALLIFANGMLSLVLDRDVVPSGGGPLLAAGMTSAAVATLAVSVAVWAAARARARAAGGSERARVPVGFAFLVGAASWLAFGLAGGAIALARSGAGEGRAVAVDGLVGPFGAAAGLLAVLVVLVFTLVLEEGGDDPRRPLWPWER